MAIRFVVDESSVRAMGRQAFGVIGIRLEKSDRVVDMAPVDDAASLLTVCTNGYGKRTGFEEYLRGGEPQGRGGSGLKNISPDLLERNGDVIGAKTVTDKDDLLCITEKGQTIRLPVSGVRQIGRSTGGVRLMELEKDDLIVSVARVPHEDEGGAPSPQQDLPLSSEGAAAANGASGDAKGADGPPDPKAQKKGRRDGEAS